MIVRLVHILLVAVLMTLVAACAGPAVPSRTWRCTVTLEAETFNRTISGSATATGGTRDQAERAARGALCSDDRLGLSSADETLCEQFGTRPSGFTSWRMQSSCSTN